MTPLPDELTRVPDLFVERYRLGEMSPAETAAFNQRLQTDDELRRRLQTLDESDQEIRRNYPPATLAARIRQRVETRSAKAGRGSGAWRPGLRWSMVAGLATVLALAVVIAPQVLDRTGGGNVSGDADRIKGLEPALFLFRKVADGSEPLADGARVREGDLIRVGYRSAGQAYGMILSIDGRGVVTKHLPRNGGPAARLSEGDRVLLDSSYELDDAPRVERFYFVTASEPFDTGLVGQAADRIASSVGNGKPATLQLNSRFKQMSVLLIKD